MKKYIYNSLDDSLIDVVEAEPQCGVDFCDSCGDCLDCYGGDRCTEHADGEHFWVEYEESEELLR